MIDNIKNNIIINMATFVFTQAFNTFEKVGNNLINQIDSSPFGNISDVLDNKKINWKKDKISNKLSELSIQTSTYNKIIPHVYGTNKLAGNVIWLDDVREVINNNTTTIKLSKGQKIKQNSIEYFYFINCAIAICGNEINSIKNVWADNTLIDLENYTYRFYNGSENQEQDPLIKNENENCTAYRGIAYIVFENFPLSQFNNRLPNFVFEITRKDDINFDNNISVCNSINGVKLFPFCGNYLYSTNIQYKSIYPYEDDYFFSGGGECEIINKNNNTNYTDSVLSLQQLKETLPNNNYYCISSTFFSDNTNISRCVLTPRVEFNYYITNKFEFFIGEKISTRPDKWNVGTKWNRFNSKVLGKDEQGNFRYSGGTPSDDSLLLLFKHIKECDGYTVFCPNIYIDTENKGEGKDLTGDFSDVNNFFTKLNGYNEFILHYANLLKGFVDVFLIGNELSGLTCLKDENNNFIAVNCLKILAQNVRNILGNNVKISYSASCKEYHNYNCWYNLDDLWSDKNIDFIGIKSYFSLTDTSQDKINFNLIKNGWTSGEDYDYITVNGVKIPIDDKFACKNMNYWWNNIHINPDLNQTSWIPNSKKIWFTEYGFCSTDATTNESYKEYDGKNSSKIPLYSYGNMDISAQKLAIEATVSFLNDNKLMIEKSFLNYWDLRPYPYFPNKTSIWPDAIEWKYNYCINNKININIAKDFILQIFKDSNLSYDLINSINIDDFVDGLVLNNSMSVNDALYILQKVCFFDCIEKFDKIDFVSNKNNEKDNLTFTEIPYNDLISTKLDEDNIFITTEINDDSLPKKLSLVFLDKNNDYDTSLVSSIISDKSSDIEIIDNIPVVLDEIKAKTLCNVILNNLWFDRISFEFYVALKYLFLEPSDLVKINTKNNSYLLKIISLSISNNMIKITAKRYNNNIYSNDNDIVLNDNLNINQLIQNCELEILELPSIYNSMINSIYLFFIVKKNSNYWNGANIYYSNNYGREYKVIQQANKNSVYGKLLEVNNNINIRPYYFDNSSSFKIYFSDLIDKDFIKNINNTELLNGENLILLGGEIIQYKTIVLNSDGSYTIKNLLRGLFGTENKIENHGIGENFIFLYDLYYQCMEYDKKNTSCLYKIVNLDDDIGNYKENNYITTAKNLKPLKPCHLRIENNYLKWNRVDRGSTSWLNDIENQCIENQEKYYLEFYYNNLLLKTFYIDNLKEFEITNDLLNKKITVKICQINQLYGKGDFATKDFILNRYINM